MTVFKQMLSQGIVITVLSSAVLGLESFPALVDLNGRTDMQVVVDREKGQYLGHPSTVLLEDGQTLFCVYPKGHGRGAIVMKRSDDAGLTWSERLPTPATWATSKEVPTLHRVIDAQGKKRYTGYATDITTDHALDWLKDQRDPSRPFLMMAMSSEC